MQFFRLRRLIIRNSAACGLKKEGYALQTLQAAVVPFLLAFTAMYAVYRGTAVFPVFIEGAKKGMQTAVGILPTMIGMLTAVYMLRASGAIDLASAWLAPLFHLLGILSHCSNRSAAEEDLRSGANSSVPRVRTAMSAASRQSCSDRRKQAFIPSVYMPDISDSRGPVTQFRQHYARIWQLL